MKNRVGRACLIALGAANLSVGQALGWAYPFDVWFASWQAWVVVPLSAFVNIYLVHRFTRGN